MNDLLYEPLKFYETQGKAQHEENCAQHFDQLLLKSGVNAEENRATVQRYKAENQKLAEIDKKISKFKLLKTLLIIGIIVGAIFLIASISRISSGDGGVGMLIIGTGFIIGGIVLLIKKINPIIKDSNIVRDGIQAKVNEILDEAKAQVAPLNALFTDTDALRMIEKTIPELQFSDRYDGSLEQCMVRHYDFVDLQDEERSMTDILAGKLAGNPFAFCRRRVHAMGSCTYHGSLVITWTETYRDSKGNLCTRTRSQTLHASVTKPKPYYHTNTYLAYGNQAAPDLSFSRESAHAEKLSDKALDRKIKKGERKLDKMAEKAVKQGGSFQEMTNSEFDVLFNAVDRDNEVQFRIMYTPLAQRNTVGLIKDKKHYGDDFNFSKMGKFNVICSDHAQNWNMDTSPYNYYSHDVDEIRSKFVSFNKAFFRSVFFDFAPLMSVPVYLDEPGIGVEYEDADAFAHYPYYSHELMANALGQSSFAHPKSDTEAILKTSLVHSNGATDTVKVTAYSYTIIPRVDFVSVLGGDGNFHAVPVNWDDYIPVSNTEMMEVAATGSPDAAGFEGGAMYCGYVARHI